MSIGKFPPHVCARILIVDDYPTTASSLARAISRLGSGIATVAANSGEQALELAQKEPVDILITDMMMTGINGLELIERLQSLPGHQPAYTMVITAYDIAGYKKMAHNLNVDEVIFKPVRPEQICQLISIAIGNLIRVKSPELLSKGLAQNSDNYELRANQSNYRK